ncbi:hypothetical protein OH76DRAFT_196638 [Lentinus brumalis]|uniref:F-box domain-containing protein n=1 Tax=Lentinus brumalis TaxID=2498619 RepID=A0A371DI39_9APHY|nr:hypothetical protein OH76DRAFT_196638 [Polyporus brumalis]
MPTFPTELFEQIIAWIPDVCHGSHEEDHALLTCSLVCSAWLPASRRQLFQTLYIKTPERYDLLVSRVLHSEKMRIYLLSVRTVEFATQSGTPAFGRPFVLEFAGHLPNVTDILFLEGSAEAYLSQPASGLAISRFALVRSLSILDCEFLSFGALRRILTSLPSLDNLELDSPSWPDPAAELSPSLSHGASTVRRPALLGLNVMWETKSSDRRRAQQFIAWLSETATSSSLLDLEVVPYSRTRGQQIRFMAIFGSSLSCFGRGLRRLNIRVVERDNPGSFDRARTVFLHPYKPQGPWPGIRIRHPA